MKKYQAYCFDLDGTVYRGKEAIQSAVRFIHKLQQQGINTYFITNNSSKTPEQLQQALENIGIISPTECIFSSALSTAKYVSKHYQDAKVHMIGSDGIKTALEAENIQLVDIDDARPDVVVIGLDRSIDYKKIIKACVAVQNGAVLIGTNQDIRFPSELGFLPGNGSFVQLVANVAAVEPIYIGKPSPVMLEMIRDKFGYKKEEMVMIGDNYETDISCGIQFGCDTIHVNTGVDDTATVLLKEQKPTYCVENLDTIEI